MREIIFRGKQIDNGEWISGDLRHWQNGKVGIHNDALRCTMVVDPETVGQYTGLKDINGRRVFEGDVFIDDDNECVGVVSWYESCFCIHWYGKDGVFMEYGYDEDAGKFGLLDTERCSDIYIGEIEVVGNIHDNPELLKEGK